MNIHRRKRTKYAALGVATYFMAYAMVGFALHADDGFVNSIISKVQDAFANGIETLTNVFVGGFVGIFQAGFQGIQDGVGVVVDLFLSVPRQFIGVIGTIFGGVTNALEQVLGIGAIHMPEITLNATAGTTGPFGIPGIGWAIIAMIIISMGLGMYQITDMVPGPGQLWTGFAVILMTIGAMLGLWGMFPTFGQYVIVSGFAVIVITAAWAVRSIVVEETGP